MSNPTPNLGSVISSASVRKVIYSAYVVALVLVGAAQVAFSAIGLGSPDWLTVATAVLAYLGIPVGGLAIANTSTSTPSE